MLKKFWCIKFFISWNIILLRHLIWFFELKSCTLFWILISYHQFTFSAINQLSFNMMKNLAFILNSYWITLHYKYEIWVLISRLSAFFQSLWTLPGYRTININLTPRFHMVSKFDFTFSPFFCYRVINTTWPFTTIFLLPVPFFIISQVPSDILAILSVTRTIRWFYAITTVSFVFRAPGA